MGLCWRQVYVLGKGTRRWVYVGVKEQEDGVVYVLGKGTRRWVYVGVKEQEDCFM